MRHRKTHESLASLLKGVEYLQKATVLQTRESQEYSLADGQHMSAPTSEEILDAVFAFSSKVPPEANEETVVRCFVETMRTLLPGRHIAVRLLSLDMQEVSLIFSTASIHPEAKGCVQLTPQNGARHGLNSTTITNTPIKMSAQYTSIFSDDAFGFEVPIVSEESFLGVLNIEYPGGLPLLDEDMHIAGQLAPYLASAIHKSQLLHQTLHLRNYLSKLLEHANAPIVVIGKRRKVKLANRAFLALTGLEREEVVNRDFMDLCPETDRARLLPVFINALRGLPTSNFELRVNQSHGEIARVSLNVASVLNAHNEVEGVICIGRDITALRQLEEQMIHAEKLATLGQLAAGVVHELNNPLTSISVYGNMLLRAAREDHRTAKEISRLECITANAERMLRFAQELVIYARPSTDEPKRVALHDVLDQAIVFCDHLLSKPDITIVRSYGAEHSHVFAIASQLHQVFINLITNACHAITHDHGELQIVTYSDPDRNVRGQITDNGKGIPSEQTSQIFEPFFTTKSEGQGTGLGLSIVRSIVEQHNGHISMRSKVGEGTAFEIMLPGAPME